MATMTFAGALSISGEFGPVVDVAPETHFKRTHFPGITGESELRLAAGGRMIVIPCWLFEEYSHTEAHAQAALLARYAGTLHDELRVPSAAGSFRTFGSCTYVGFNMGPLGIIPDVAGTLGTEGKFWFAGELMFRQLRA